MGDLVRSYNDIELQDAELKTSLTKIQLSEKRNQLKQLDVALDKLKTVDIKKIEHQMKAIEKQIEMLDNELIVNEKVIDV